MNLMVWLLRARRWVTHPPSPRRVALVLGVVAASLVLYGVERFVGWPEALQVNPPPKP